MGILVVLGLSAAGAAMAQAPNIRPDGVVNFFSSQPALAPGVLASVYGANLSEGTCTTREVPVPTRLCNAQVTVNGVACPILFASPGQLNIQFPTNLQPGTYPLAVERASVRSEPVNVKVDAFAPGLPTDATVAGLGVFLHADATRVTPQDPAEPGEVVICQAVGLGPTNPPVAAGATAPLDRVARTTTAPKLSVGGQEALLLFSGLTPGAVGLYQVNFVTPLPQPTRQFTLSIGGFNSNAVTLPIDVRPPQINSIVNGASFGSPAVAAAGSILTIFGRSFGQNAGSPLFPATSFQGLSVTFNGTAAPLFAIAGGQINVLAPTELPETGNVTVQVKNAVGASANFTLRMAPAAPGIFVFGDPSEETSRRIAVALFANTRWLVMPASTARGLEIPENCRAGGVDPLSVCGQPAVPGDFLQVFVTGLGRATPNGDPAGRVLPSGSVAPASGNPLYRTVLQPAVTIGGVTAEVQFSGLAPGFAGLYQVNVQVPNGAPAGDDVLIKITLPDGSTDSATIAVARP